MPSTEESWFLEPPRHNSNQRSLDLFINYDLFLFSFTPISWTSDMLDQFSFSLEVWEIGIPLYITNSQFSVLACIQGDLSTVPGTLPALSSVLAGAVSSFTFRQRKILTNAFRKLGKRQA